MDAATAIASGVLATALAFAAARKLTHRPEVVASYERVGVPEDRLNHLAAILLAGAGGLVAGIFWAPIGVAAAGGVVVYFALAVGAHFRTGDVEHAPTPVAIEIVAVAVLVLQLATL